MSAAKLSPCVPIEPALKQKYFKKKFPKWGNFLKFRQKNAFELGLCVGSGIDTPGRVAFDKHFPTA
ncbi:MAG: hypothetical protein IJO87_06700 [Eggerthellaceae bacterium]|nr:hypothetical protein [Eggerthellaceae bacterium]